MESFKLACTLQGHEDDVKSLFCLANGDILSGLRDATCRLWKMDEEKGWKTGYVQQLLAFQSPENAFVNTVGYAETEEGPFVIAGGKDCIIYLCDGNNVQRGINVATGDYVKYQLVGHQNNICSLDQKGGLLLSGSWDGTAKVWDLASKILKFDLLGHELPVWDAKIVDEAGQVFLTCSADRTIRKWVGERELWRIEAHNDVVRKLLILPGGKSFASASNDCKIKIWNLETGQLLRTLSGHSSFIYDLDLLPDGELVSSGEDRMVRIWRDGTVVQAITLPCISVWCVGVLPEGDLAVGGSDKAIRIFTRAPSRVAPEYELGEFSETVKQSSIPEQSLDELNKTDLPGYEALESPGKAEGSVIMVKSPDGTIEAQQWSGGEWVKIGDVVGSTKSTKGKQEFCGKEYDYVFDVDIEDGAPPLKLPYNVNENPHVVAQRFLADNELPASYTQEVVNFILKNTEGAELNYESGPVYNPYADNQQPNTKTSASMNVIPQSAYINFEDFKVDQLVKGLTKFNHAQVEPNRLQQYEIDDIISKLGTLGSRDATTLINKYLRHIFDKWDRSTLLIGYDLLRISLPHITTADIIHDLQLAETVRNSIMFGLDICSTSSQTLFMMILKVVNNLIGSTLFIQIFVTTDTENKLQFSDEFDTLVLRISAVMKALSSSEDIQESKHYSSVTNTLATFIYNMSAFHLRNSQFKANPTAARHIVELIGSVQDLLMKSGSESAYRFMMGLGNYKHAKVNIDDSCLTEAEKFREQRFEYLIADLKRL